MRIGLGYDIHRLVAGRRLIIGGVDIPFGKGLLGHSDADVLLHAICDALLGAAALGDIGRHFPDSDPAYRDVSSRVLLSRVNGMLRQQGYSICNIDTILFAEQPKLAPFSKQIQGNVAQLLSLPSNAVGIKATTTEGMGAIGNGKAIAAMATALIESAVA
jgi:2-C-methyl-D-erythritol 2,4-cyclodiphosphate synthase